MHEQRWRYYTFFKNDGEMYGYTDDKELAKAFYEIRDHRVLFRKRADLSSADLRELHNYYPEATLKWSSLSGVRLPITTMEFVTIQHVIAQRTMVDIPLSAIIDPEIFTKEFQEDLAIIGYTAAHRCYVDGSDSIATVDPLLTFVKLYGNTLNWEGKNIYETLSILLNRSSRN